MGDVTNNFSRDEFKCPCCGLNKTNDSVIRKLQELRDAVCVEAGRDVSFIIHSGTRCEKHNKEVGGKPNSAHLDGDGIDIRCNDGNLRYIIDGCARKLGYRRIGIARGFVHVDQSRRLPQDNLWLY
jgi:uncharacterized protein YcbK (DUF882 family)